MSETKLDRLERATKGMRRRGKASKETVREAWDEWEAWGASVLGRTPEPLADWFWTAASTVDTSEQGWSLRVMAKHWLGEDDSRPDSTVQMTAPEATQVLYENATPDEQRRMQEWATGEPYVEPKPRPPYPYNIMPNGEAEYAKSLDKPQDATAPLPASPEASASPKPPEAPSPPSAPAAPIPEPRLYDEPRRSPRPTRRSMARPGDCIP